jgi:hypothetical protein
MKHLEGIERLRVNITYGKKPHTNPGRTRGVSRWLASRNGKSIMSHRSVSHGMGRRAWNLSKGRGRNEQRYHWGRVRSLPTQIVNHRIVTGPPCHLRADGISPALRVLPSPSCLLTSIGPNTACARWSSHAKSAGIAQSHRITTRMRMARLYGTWMAHSLHSCHQCLALFTHRHFPGHI